MPARTGSFGKDPDFFLREFILPLSFEYAFCENFKKLKRFRFVIPRFAAAHIFRRLGQQRSKGYKIKVLGDARDNSFDFFAAPVRQDQRQNLGLERRRAA